MWFDRAEMRKQWVRLRRPKGDVTVPFEAVNLCDVGGYRGITLRRTREPLPVDVARRYGKGWRETEEPKKLREISKAFHREQVKARKQWQVKRKKKRRR